MKLHGVTVGTMAGIYLAASAVGAVGWVLALPFSAIGGNVEETGRVLVKEPLQYTFTRPVGYMDEGTRSRYTTER